MKIYNNITGKLAPGDWADGSEMNEDEPCPECGAEPGQQCSFEDPEHPGMGIEVGAFIHSSRATT